MIAELINQPGGVRWFTKLDLRLGYYQVMITERDEMKMTCMIRYRSYEFLVMPFQLTNTPITFYKLMDNVLQPILNQFLIMFLEDYDV